MNENTDDQYFFNFVELRQRVMRLKIVLLAQLNYFRMINVLKSDLI